MLTTCMSQGCSQIRCPKPHGQIGSCAPQALITSAGMIHAELLEPSEPTPAITVTFLYRVQPTGFQFTLGLKQPLQVSFLYLMRHMNTIVIAFGVCYSQSHGWAGFLFEMPRDPSALADGTALPAGPALRTRGGEALLKPLGLLLQCH